VGIGRGSVDRERVYAPTWVGPLSKLGQNISTNGLNSYTYRLKYPICFIYFIFGYSLDTYPSRIGEFGGVSVFCRWIEVLETVSCRNASKDCVHKT
jgi:hypothetical protein